MTATRPPRSYRNRDASPQLARSMPHIALLAFTLRPIRRKKRQVNGDSRIARWFKSFLILHLSLSSLPTLPTLWPLPSPPWSGPILVQRRLNTSSRPLTHRTVLAIKVVGRAVHLFWVYTTIVRFVRIGY